MYYREVCMNSQLELNFDALISIPKYKVIIEAVYEKIKTGEWKRGDKIPSLNQLCRQYALSQDTVLMAYNELKARGIIASQVGKGYYIQSDSLTGRHRVLLLFDTLSAYKEELYSAFKAELQGEGSEQIFFHHNNLKLFKTILQEAVGEYSAYVIMPVPGKEAREIVSTLPSKKVYILDQGRKEFGNQYAFVCQDFERDIYRILKEYKQVVMLYNRLVLVVREQRLTHREIAMGFRDYGRSIDKQVLIINHMDEVEPQRKDLFVVVDDRDLAFLVRHSAKHNWLLGSDLGIVSYNEAPLKSVVSTGITTISTDFVQMGQSMARMIMQNKHEKIDNPFLMYRRSSF